MASVVIGFIIFLGNFIYLCASYVTSLINVRDIVVSTNPVYMAFFTIYPAIWWAYSTKEDAFNFYNRKHMTLRLVIVNDLLVIAQAAWIFTFNAFVYRICTLPVGRNFSEEMILNLCRMVLSLGSFGLVAAIYKVIDSILTSEDMKEGIETFRWQHVVDDRKNISHLYDLDIVRRMQDGRHMIIKEVDRFVHMFILGQSGTGKTSSTFLPAIICDLDKKIKNMMERQAALKRMVEKKEAEVVQISPYLPIDEHCVRPKEGMEGKYISILKRLPDCGVTLMAPNNSANKGVIKLCKARGIICNVIDPAENLQEDGVVMKGLNPLYIPTWLDGDDRQILISNRAQNFAEVLLAVSEIHGVGDPYFRDINSSVTTNVAIICMLDANLRGTQTNIKELQDCIQNFAMLQPKIAQICDKFHMRIDIAQDDTKKPDRVDKDVTMLSGKLTHTDITTVPEKYEAMGWTMEEYTEYVWKQAENYYPSIYFVMSELLGPGYAKMFDQARGLRNIVNNLLLDPRVATLLSADEANMLDFDRMLLNNEVTVINTALEFGSQSSTALGVFIILNFKLAVMRRASIPEADRTNHFVYIDEASQYMHPVYEDMFALFRQYRVAVTLALQSQTQMDKSPVTKYLRGVIRGAGTHIVFGRADSEEMKYYEELMGIEKREVIQTTVNSNSEFDENYKVTQGQRVTTQEEAAVTASQIRIRDFQEVTMLMIDRGRVLKGFIGKVRFPSKKAYLPRKNIVQVDFSKYAATAESPMAPGVSQINKTKKEAQKEAIEQYETTITSVEKQDTYTKSDSSLLEDIGPRPVVHTLVADEYRDRVGSADQFKSALLNDTFNVEPTSEIEEIESPQMSGIDPLSHVSSADAPLRVPNMQRQESETPKTPPPAPKPAEDIDFSSFLGNQDPNTDEEEPLDSKEDYEEELRKLNSQEARLEV